MSERQAGTRYTDRGQTFEWVNGCESIPVREMTGRERMTWNSALRIARTFGRDEADDEMARRANNLEEASVRSEHRGMHNDATDAWRCSELFDVARASLIR